MQAETPPESTADAGRRRWHTTAVIAATVAGTVAYGQAKWWQDGFTGRWRTVNEGWFGESTEFGGADKLGHAMFAYTGTRLLSGVFESIGHGTDESLHLAWWTAVGTLLGVEVLDGFSREWRFSAEDVVADLAGGFLAHWLQTQPAVDDLVDIRLQYSHSRRPSGRRSFDPFGDYSGQRYLLVLKASGIAAWRERPLLRYLEFNIGYGATNVHLDGSDSGAPRRHAYYGVALNISEVLRTSVFGTGAPTSRVQRGTDTFLEFGQIPAATAQVERDIR